MRTATIDVDAAFLAPGEITKVHEDAATGKRTIRGVASGVEEDRDGERVSANALTKMVTQVQAGGRKLTTNHQQDWDTEIGDITSAFVDKQTGQLVIDCELPPAGADPLADRAWARLTAAGGQPLGFSIGGKLRKAYYETVGTAAKRRKVLDEIELRHACLTAKPAYQLSFAEAVAKTATLPEVGELMFYTDSEAEAVSKARDDRRDDEDDGQQYDDPEADGEDGDDAGPVADDVADGEDDAGQYADEADGDEPIADGSDDEDEGPSAERMQQEDALELPKVRHLACPACGHEFAAQLPVNRSDMPDTDHDVPDDDRDDDRFDEAQATDSEGENAKPSDDDDDDDDDSRFPVRRREGNKTMSELDEAMDVLKHATHGVAADDDASDEPLPSVEKMLAASHYSLSTMMGDLESRVGEAMTLVAKAVTDLHARLDDRPVGRRSVARVLPTRDEVEKTGGDAASLLEQAATPTDALKILNEQTYGIR